MNYKYYFCPSKTLRLENALQKKSNSLSKRWKHAKQTLTVEIDKRYRIAYPDFPPKASEHGEQGICFFNGILPDEHLDSLNPEEILLLMASSFIHDIGLISENEPFVPSPHALHFEQGQKIILNQEWLPFSKEEREILAILARWHNYTKWVQNGAKKEPCRLVDNKKIRVDLLLQLLQLSDMYHHIVDHAWGEIPELKDLEKKGK